MDEVRRIFQTYEPRPLDVEKAYAVLIPLVKLEGEWHILFEHRAIGISQAGDAAFPGGRVEAGESFEQAAIRETAEELGISPDKIAVVGEMDYIVMGKRMIGCYVGELVIDSLTQLTLNKNEVDHIFTVPLRKLKAMEPDVHYVAHHQEVSDDFPFDLIPGGKQYDFGRSERRGVYFYNIKGEHLWGMTAKLTARFVDILKGKHLAFNQDDKEG
ncbi:NUDIX hydrolase [Aerococcus urinaeequi]|uniref:NUDIX hydrolase n=1 Tax=Aerococcus sp. HMSC10H05 TaxID=1581084 RepID=UPI0008A4DD1E|nr:CoA pyrophosphatase [Aerococcus sp. HMSC10H05]OFU52987.1 coenzyme A pyrophosphatase [Aerococcus sp. HMSC10H05]